MKKTIVIIALLPFLALAQSGEMTVGERTVVYDSSTTTIAGTLYYADEYLVASEHEAVTLVYENDEVVLEAHDTNGDGTLDAFLTLDANDEVTNVTGEGASTFERPEVKEFSELAEEEGAGPSDEDLVGDLDSITIPGSGSSVWFFIFLVIFVVGSWWYYKRKQDE